MRRAQGAHLTADALAGDPRIGSYGWPGGRESLLRFGSDTGPLAIVALPLFEEANRTRAFAVAILHALAARGVGGLLPDLPGTGESLVATIDARLVTMRDAYRALVEGLGRPVYAVAIRSGALLDAGSAARARWHLAPQSGDDLLRDLWRVRQAATGDRAAFDPAAIRGATTFAGNDLSPDMLRDLAGAVPAAARTIRLDTDPRPADRKLPGTPLWRRAEPDTDAPLARALADDIADWIARCEA